MPIGSIFEAIGNRLQQAGAAGSNPAYYYAQQQQAQKDQIEQQRLQQLGQIITDGGTPGDQITALSRLGTPEAIKFAMQLSQGKEVPANIKEFQAVQALSPEQQKAYQEFKNPQAPVSAYQQEQLNIEKAKLTGPQQLLAQASALETAGRRQEAAALRQQAQQAESNTSEQNQVYNFGRVPDPLANIKDTKRRDIETGALGREAEKAIQTQAEFVAQAQAEKANLQKFTAAQQRQGGSPVVTQSIPGIAALQRTFDSDVADMAQVQAQLAPSMRQPGAGATSDYDAKQFERATVGPDKPTETNNAIIKARTVAADNVIAKADFLESYRADNGHVRGAEAAWRKYLEANPIFDPKNPGTFDINPNRTSWDQFFSKSQSGGVKQQQNSVPVGGIIEDAQGNRFRNVGGKWQPV